MKRFFLLLIIVGIYACQSNGGFINYRNDPFQFPYPEYYLKAKEINLRQAADNPNQVSIETVNERISFDVDKNLHLQTKKKLDSYYLWSGEKLFGVINFEKEVYMGCGGAAKAYQKDFCSAFNSTEEYFSKLFKLTPDDLATDEYAGIGNKWIVHNKGSWFRNVNQLFVYHLEDNVAFRRDFKPGGGQKMKTELIIFPKAIAPNYVGIGLATQDSKIVEKIISSFQAKGLK